MYRQLSSALAAIGVALVKPKIVTSPKAASI
jgi:hypothetical protein